MLANLQILIKQTMVGYFLGFPWHFQQLWPGYFHKNTGGGGGELSNQERGRFAAGGSKFAQDINTM